MKTKRQYRMRSEVPDLLDRAGLTQAELARRAGLTRFGLRDKLTQGQPTTGITAWKLARGYAAATGISEEDAFTALWEVIGEQPRITRTPDLAARLPIAY